ncbi:hypothetical protein I6A60_00395 [Frankia sp. AgB1.9]|uniref:hypothetical protein n=1 Tax=unclassified Frankia TaxID=2632575 RepID=UPI0019345083|nr:MULTISPECIES: hypothetical protein [unclassified Frankia]MBL7487339.1 hypothetical protein [Frankia sp. AgW1.1]MBL7546347.1 hypothetical protein [Frankia sp. AgB1.9]MBL7618607.1 hypothetical protein [Frankia sp. AgB1.8]
MPGRFRRPRPETDQERNARLAGTILNGHWQAVQVLDTIALDDLEPGEKIAYAQTLALLAAVYRLDKLTGPTTMIADVAGKVADSAERLGFAAQRIADFGIPPREA